MADTFLIEIVFTNHDEYSEITRADLEQVLRESDLARRDLLVQGLVKPATVSSSDDVDLTLVIDSQPAQERWADFVEECTKLGVVV